MHRRGQATLHDKKKKIINDRSRLTRTPQGWHYEILNIVMYKMLKNGFTNIRKTNDRVDLKRK